MNERILGFISDESVRETTVPTATARITGISADIDNNDTLETQIAPVTGFFIVAIGTANNNDESAIITVHLEEREPVLAILAGDTDAFSITEDNANTFNVYYTENIGIVLQNNTGVNVTATFKAYS